MKNIKRKKISNCNVTIPGSKSISHRMLICAALAEGRTILKNLLESEDLVHTSKALINMGAVIKPNKKGEVIVQGFNGQPTPFNEDIYLGNSGTSMRLLAGIAALGHTPYTLTGDERMQERPMGELLEALNMAGARAESITDDGTPPVIIDGYNLRGGLVELDCSRSSQYLSSLLMMGAVLKEGLVIRLPGPAVSVPYVNLTMDVMSRFNVKAERTADDEYRVSGGQAYAPGTFAVEPDISNASYFWAAGAVTGKRIQVNDINRNSLQGDIRFLDILEKMGCDIDFSEKGIGVLGKKLRAVQTDMSDIPDVVPTLAIIASFAEGTTRILNIGHLREKECDRITAVVSQLRKMGIRADEGGDWLSVTGSSMHTGAKIETFNDHRIAMAFSIAGLRVDGICIENEGCVAKSFPGFWDTFNLLGGE